MKIYNCNQGETWDYISYIIFGDEFKMDLLMEQNQYYHSDTLSFEFGDTINIPEYLVIENSIIKSPWE
jgi:hypothetical protein